MRHLMLLLCLSACAVTSPSREELLGEEPSSGPSLVLPPGEATPTATPSDAKCPPVTYNFCGAERYRIEGVFFETNSAALIFPESTASLNELLRSLLSQPTLQLVIEVHTDAQGADSYNMVMSQKRADALVDYLVKLGVPVGQLEAKGYGESKPLNAGKTAEERKLNRRIELALRPKP